ncbi:MAG: MFS transporter [Gemmatimonadota bacterium]
MAGVGEWLRKLVDFRKGEGPALVWSCTFFFFLLCSYYIMRPIRDEMGVAAGVDNLAFLFTGTLIGTLAIHPIFTFLVSRLPRQKFVPYIYRFFILNLVGFYFLFSYSTDGQAVWVARAFFVWLSIINLFLISIFWSFMTDIYRPLQSKRLFGVVAVGGTVGATLGSTITTTLVGMLGPIMLLLVAAALLELAAQASRILDRHEGRLAAVALAYEQEAVGKDRDVEKPPPAEADAEPGLDKGEEVIGGKVLDGIRHVVTSPYLLGIAGFVGMFAIISTFLYFQVAALMEATYPDDPASRTQVFGARDLAVNMLTLVTQLFLTGRILRYLGVGLALAFLPVLSMIGFGILGAAPVLLVAIIFEVLRRAGNFAVMRPTREVLYTVLPRGDRYKAKNFNDTFVYRLGDQLGAWTYQPLYWLGLSLGTLAFIMVPVSVVWLLLALWLGKAYRDNYARSTTGDRER